MLKKSWLFLLPLVASLLWMGSAPSHAAGESFKYLSVSATGCTSGAYTMSVDIEGLDGGGGYIARTVVTSGGLTYMNEEAGGISNGVRSWSLFNLFTYGAVANQGTWPIPQNQQLRITTTLERPKGTVLSSWTLVVAACNSSSVLFNGDSATDTDEDLVATPTDVCPTVQGFTANGCPLRARTMSLRAKYGPKRVVGRLYATGYPALYAGRTVTIWKVRPGPDLRVRTRITNSLGKFKARLPKGRYYAMSAGAIVPSLGEATANTSRRVRLR